MIDSYSSYALSVLGRSQRTVTEYCKEIRAFARWLAPDLDPSESLPLPAPLVSWSVMLPDCCKLALERCHGYFPNRPFPAPKPGIIASVVVAICMYRQGIISTINNHAPASAGN